MDLQDYIPHTSCRENISYLGLAKASYSSGITIELASISLLIYKVYVR